MPKLFKIFTVLMIASLVLAACAPAATQAPIGAPATDEPSDEPTSEAPDAPTSGIDCKGAQSGDTISMMYQWAGEEEARMTAILQTLVDACGLVLEPESTRDQGLLDTRVQAGTPPDVAFWNVTQLVQYQEQLQAMDSLGASQDSYIPGANDQAVIGGRWIGLPVKSDIKTIIWYSPVAFEAFGYTVPTTWDELEALADQMVADGNVPWSMGIESGDATGWTGSDFIQDILLVQQGPEYVMGLIDGSIAYDDAGVVQAYETYGQWATDADYAVGGAQGTLSTGFNDAILKVFSDPPEAMMVKQSGFAQGTITAQYADLQYGTDFDFFVVPGAQGLQGGSDWMMAFSDSPAVQALVTYLASPEGGANWAAAGFGLSPNKSAEGNFTDTVLVKLAEAFYSTGALTPDIGDSIPGGFGSAEWTAIVDYLNGADLAGALAVAAGVQAEATGQ
ncbi:MAG: ABC transporter substrate-binding protein [Anaerolineales bacterium]